MNPSDYYKHEVVNKVREPELRCLVFGLMALIAIWVLPGVGTVILMWRVVEMGAEIVDDIRAYWSLR